MKMISSTSKTSISGVTLIYGSAVVYHLSHHYHPYPSKFLLVLIRFMKPAARRNALLLVSHQSDLIDTKLAYFIDDVYYVAVVTPTPLLM